MLAEGSHCFQQGTSANRLKMFFHFFMHLTYLMEEKKSLTMHLGSEKNAKRKLEEKGGEIKVLGNTKEVVSEMHLRGNVSLPSYFK